MGLSSGLAARGGISQPRNVENELLPNPILEKEINYCFPEGALASSAVQRTVPVEANLAAPHIASL